MFSNFLKVALRNLSKNKLHSFINIFGLSLGMAVAILIGLYVQNELDYDTWFDQPDEVYRVYRQWAGDGGTIWTPSLLAQTLQDNFPEVITASGLANYGEVLLDKEGQKMYVDDVAMVDSTFFNIASFPFLQGNPAKALAQPNTIVLSKELAEKLYGQENPIGKSLRFNDENDYMVTGVLDDPPGNSHIDYNAYIQFTYYSPYWTGNNRATYVSLRKDADIPGFENRLTDHLTKLMEKELLAMGLSADEGDLPAWKLQPFEDIHLHSSGFNWINKNDGDIKYVYIFILISVLILLVAVINYTNLSTAQATQRAKEVGMRKVSGARKSQIVTQFLAESLVQSMLALLLAVVLAEFLLPYFNQITGRELGFLRSDFAGFLVPLVILAIIVGLIAGSYPALILSAFQPIKVLKGRTAKIGGKLQLRKALVVAQFAITISLIIIMTFIYKQVNFMTHKDLGFKGDQVIVVPFNQDDSFRKFTSLKQEFLSIPTVNKASSSSRVPGYMIPDWGVQIQGKEEESIYPYVIFTDEDYVETLGLSMEKGRYLSSEFAADTQNNYVVNEAFVKQNQLSEPLGTRIKFSSDTVYGQIVGVLKDFHVRGLSHPIKPLVIGGASRRYFATFNVSPQNLPQTIASIEKIWAKVEPAHPMRHSFLDDDFGEQYLEQRRFGKALLYSAVLTIFIAMLGLFGLASFTAQKRIKEIGIRKVLGATVGQISFMLIKDFVILVLISGLIALPTGFLLTRRWLEDFAYSTDINWVPFLAALVLALLIASLTVSYQAIRAASVNPVKSLRYE